MQPLLAAPRQDLTEAIVRSALALDHAPRIRHGVDVLDGTDVPTGESLLVETGAVHWSYRPPSGGTSAAETRRTADLTVVGDTLYEVITRRYRIWTEIQAPTGEWVRSHLGVFLPTNPGADDDGLVVRRNLKLADKTWRYANRFLTEPVTVAAGTNAVQRVIDDLAAEFGETAFSITASDVTLSEPRMFESGDSWLQFFNGLLELAGYDGLTSDENGLPRSVPLADLAGKGSEYTYAPAAGKVMTAGSVEPLLPSLANVARFVARQGPSLPEEGNGIATRTNQSTGPGSIDQRGEEVHVEVQVEAEDQAQLEAIADAEAQRVFAGGGLRAQVRVGLNFLHGDRDVITLVKPRLGLSGEWWVTSWTFPLEPVTSESAVTMPLTCEARVVVS